MKRWLALAGLFVAGAAHADQAVTWRTLLEEMTDRECCPRGFRSLWLVF